MSIFKNTIKEGEAITLRYSNGWEGNIEYPLVTAQEYNI